MVNSPAFDQRDTLIRKHVKTTLSSIARGLDKVRWHGDYKFTACCPAHDDRNPSLSVSDSNRKILVKCWAGCSQESVIGAFRDMGLWHTASRHLLERRKRAELKEGIRKHKQILDLGVNRLNQGIELSEMDKAQMKRSIGFLREHANG